MLPLTVCVIAVAGLLACEYYALASGKALTKLAASSAFIWFALEQGALGSVYGQLVLAALVLCWWGDAFLLSSGRSAFFLAGIGAFLLAHVVYIVAFAVAGVNGMATALAAALCAIFAGVIWRWLGPYVPRKYTAPVVAYVVVLSLMVAVAAGTFWTGGNGYVLAGASAFAASDVSVARDRFVRRQFANRAWGLPLYYCAQLLLAGTVA